MAVHESAVIGFATRVLCWNDEFDRLADNVRHLENRIKARDAPS